MNQSFQPTEIPDVALVRFKTHTDARGFFRELGGRFDSASHSRSTRGVLRGLHYQAEKPQAKLASVVSGRIFDVAVDLRESAPTFGRWVGKILYSGTALWIPEGFAHGFFVLSKAADIVYQCTGTYVPSLQRIIRWDDADLAIRWPGTRPLLSDRDANAGSFRDAEYFP